MSSAISDCSEPCDPNLQLLDMPAVLLTMILQHVPLQQRLGVCTRVCHAFHTAAVAATNSISISCVRSRAQRDNISGWLQLHGGGITCINVQDGRGLCLACWPCPVLTNLNSQEQAVQPGLFSACSNLTRLLLTYRYFQFHQDATSSAAGSNQLTQLSALRSLRHLDLCAVVPFGDGVRARCLKSTVCCEFPGRLLSQLVQLTCLKLRDNVVCSDAALQHLGSLSALQHLELNLEGRIKQQLTAATLNGLQQLPQLTALKLFRAAWAINLHSMPAFSVLTALRVLQLQDSTLVDPAVLATFSQLQQLDLNCKELWETERSTGAHCSAMLAAVGQQQGLTRLRISFCCCCSPPSAAGYSALTASSHLQHLEFRLCNLPAGAWQHMFPPTRFLPKLRHLLLSTSWGQVQPLSHADIQAMVSCCPGLVNISLGQHLPISTVTPLQHLTGLTALGVCASFKESAPSLARLANLQRLVMQSDGEADRVTISGLLQLTVLQQLRHLEVSGAACDPGLTPLLCDCCSTKRCLRVNNTGPFTCSS